MQQTSGTLHLDRVLHVPSYQTSTTVQYIDSALERAQCVWAGVDSRRLLMNIHCTMYMLEAEWASGNEISAVNQYEKQAKQTFFLQFINQIVFTQINLRVIPDQH